MEPGARGLTQVRSGVPLGSLPKEVRMRAFIVTVSGLLTAATLALASAAPAGAAPLRVWGYWQAEGGKPWAFATTGPAQAKPADGAVEGWRFAVSKGEQGTPPRAKADFAAVCGSEHAKAGHKRVAVVIDDGESPDAPEGQTPPAATTGCAVVAKDATGADVLAAVGTPRTAPKGLICTSNADPAGACGQPAGAAAQGGATPAPGAAGGSDGGSTSLGLVTGVVVVLAVAGAGLAFAVRRPRTDGPAGR